MPIKTSQKILVLGGAGFIGSHMLLSLKQAGYLPLVLDNFVTGHEDALQGVEYIKGDMQDADCLKRVFREHEILAVMHFAAFIQVGESVLRPDKYYQNNLAGSLHLLLAMQEAKVKYFIFSSTAAVYGEPQYLPMDEKHPLSPINPYGKSKWMFETILADFARAGFLHYGVLRYFNAAGAVEGLAERHEPETHLIPLLLSVASGQRPSITVYGDDYPTEDGTCVRDYVHVKDLCEAHLFTLEALFQGKNDLIYNLGSGQGYTVKQVIQSAEKITGKKIPYQVVDRRPGDPAVLVADPSKAGRELNWFAKHSDLHEIIADAWRAYESIPSES